MAKPAPEEPEEPGCPLWMVTFGDCMSLLCTFFVMLIAFSRIEEHKLMELIGALKGGLGMTPIMEDRPGMSRMSQNLRLTAGSAKQQTLLTEEEISKVASHEQVIERRYAPSSVGGTAIEIMVYLLDEGLALIIQTESVFKEGTAEFLPGTDDLWMSFGDLAAHLDCEVRVIGAVPEDMPIKTPKVRTVWGLASERAIAVQKLLVDQCNYDPERFSIGTRIEGGAQQADAAAAFPPDRIELILMGYRPPFQVTPESVIIREL